MAPSRVRPRDLIYDGTGIDADRETGSPAPGPVTPTDATEHM